MKYKGNIEADGNIKVDGETIVDTIQLGDRDGDDKIFRVLGSNIDSVSFFNGQQSTSKLYTNYYMDGDDLVIQPQGRNAVYNYLIKSLKINNNEVVTGAQAVIDQGKPQLNLKQGDEIVASCDLSPVLSGEPVNIFEAFKVEQEGWQENPNPTEDIAENYDYVTSSITNISEIFNILKSYKTGFKSTSTDFNVYHVTRMAPQENWAPYPQTYFTLTFCRLQYVGSRYVIEIGEIEGVGTEDGNGGYSKLKLKRNFKSIG